jgi:creatinine amidohydrolase
MLWHELSWPAIQATDKNIPVVIPLGSCEQHGHHLPLLTDTIQVTALAEQVEQHLRDKILLTPTLWLGSSHHHKDFPGTLSVLPSLYTQVIQSITQCVLQAGFRRLFFFNGHGGNEVPAAQALSELVAADDHADDAYLVFASWWQIGKDAIEPKRHGMATANITHACEYETSMMLFMRPDLVDTEKACDPTPAFKSPWLSRGVQRFRRFHRLTPTGNFGQPTAATANKGQAMSAAIIQDVASFLQDFATWPDLPPLKPL